MQEGVEQAEAQVVKNPETTILIEELDVLVEKIAKSGEKKTPDFSDGKTLPTAKQTVGQIFEKFETPLKRNLMSPEMREKCYLWVTRIRTYADDSTDEYNSLCKLNAQQPLVLSRVHFASLKAKSYIEADNMAIENLPNGEFLQPKSKKPFNVEDYPMFLPFLDRKKLASHPYGYVISRIRKDREIEPLYIDISGQKTEYKSFTLKNCTDVDHFRVEFASRILFHDMNRDRDATIMESEKMRLSKPSAALLSPYYQVDSYDIESDSD
ncbi:hypothetical protein Ahy_B10g101195 [Arachis hypogaea]|uniref:Uncharacterized protein n=1 Tax=Arachis hypogaea TaxID=3818 RepID=A0A444WZ37_ARAHY|nr:hypothetical protein Ahy_B10g101195 [Arachis hypogaea]